MINKILCNRYFIVTDLDDVFKSCYYEYPLASDYVDWFVNEVVRLENKMSFCFKNTNKDIIRTHNDEDRYKNNITCRFFGKKHWI